MQLVCHLYMSDRFNCHIQLKTGTRLQSNSLYVNATRLQARSDLWRPRKQKMRESAVLGRKYMRTKWNVEISRLQKSNNGWKTVEKLHIFRVPTPFQKPNTNPFYNQICNFLAFYDPWSNVKRRTIVSMSAQERFKHQQVVYIWQF